MIYVKRGLYFFCLIATIFFLTGCTDQSEFISGNTNKIDIIDYHVVTQRSDSEYSSEFTLVGEGFINEMDLDTGFYRYYINGTIRNIAGTMLAEGVYEKILIITNFFDSDGVYLGRSTFVSYEALPANFTLDFGIICSEKYPYFSQVEDFKFEVVVK
jgi:hypothetical protein